ncbi:hypothetical protein CC86DRAFT_406871 [Ophiobolus disseminans]|uniref:Uncharacterized protein n=1 Tax=Ophiobolus disseminans TaxID=1469910 RepID=A0A6A6ZYU3_9PLEO|nr:hypothetical protein CC86DRAFT_406871 [Ophiobolus disseminans]
MLFPIILTWVCLFGTGAAQWIKQSANQPVTFDDTCNDAQKKIIVNALTDSYMMADFASEANGRLDLTTNNPAFLDLFGLTAMNNLSTIEATFKKLVYNYEGWKIAASCDLNDSDPLCADPTSHGFIGSEFGQSSSFSPRFVFCNTFWGLSPLYTQMRKAIGHYWDLSARFDLGYYSSNQGTAVLRKLMQHTPPEGGMSRRISELWVLLPYHDGTAKWTACRGIY